MTKGSATSITVADTASYPETNPDNGTIVTAGTVLSEEEADDAVIGALVVKSNDKALILPQVTDATQLPQPQAGMICYDLASDSIAVFNSEVWSFWN